MRWQLVFVATLGCGRVTTPDGLPHDANGTDAVAGEPSFTPSFVQSSVWDCGAVQTACKVPNPGTGTNRLVLVTVTYSPQMIQVQSVVDDNQQSFRRAIEPIAWASGDGNLQTELWWAPRSKGATTVMANFSGPTSGVNIYVDEFVATAIDQTASASGKATGEGSFSSGARTTKYAKELIFGHGEGRNVLLSPGPGFTTRSTELGNIEQTKVVDTVGEHEASFAIDRSGHWMALMVTLR